MGFYRGPKIVTDGLVLYVDAANPKSYVSGSTTTRSLVGSVTGSLVNGVGFSTGSNGSWVFDGSNDYIGIPHSSILAPTSQISFGCFAFLNDWNTLSAMRLMSKTQLGGYQIGMNEGVNYSNFLGGLVYAGGSYRTTKYPLSSITSGWHHIMYTFDGRYFKMYLDGVNVDTFDVGSNVSISYSFNNSLLLGAEPGSADLPDGQYFNGRLSNAIIYNRALSAAEVLQNYNATKSRFGL